LRASFGLVKAANDVDVLITPYAAISYGTKVSRRLRRPSKTVSCA